MEHEGMVHALADIHRLLKSDGKLIDLHPFAEAPLIEVHQDGRVVFAEPIPIQYVEDVEHAEKALAHVVRHGLYALERAREFDFRIYGSSVAELSDFLIEAGAYDDSPLDETVAAQRAVLAARVEGVMQAAGEGAEVVHLERVHIARLAPL
jgi:hypothetical protein